jgi:hypothetical protein
MLQSVNNVSTAFFHRVGRDRRPSVQKPAGRKSKKRTKKFFGTEFFSVRVSTDVAFAVQLTIQITNCLIAVIKFVP